jgi:hypothetical protein
MVMLAEDLAGDAAVAVTLEVGVEHGVGDEVAHLVRMALAQGSEVNTNEFFERMFRSPRA